jgi:hypothetical protein
MAQPILYCPPIVPGVGQSVATGGMHLVIFSIALVMSLTVESSHAEVSGSHCFSRQVDPR